MTDRRHPQVPLRRAAAALALLPLLLTGCAGEEAEPETAPLSAPATPEVRLSPTATPSVPPTAGQAVDEEPAATVQLTVVGGQVTGDTGRVPVDLGERVRLTITADVTDEVHVHGYDLHQDTVPGQPVTLEFVADRPGVFEVELEETRTLLTRLQVR